VNQTSVVIRCHGNGRAYRPGETLCGEYWIESAKPGEVKAVEVSVLWYTAGKGDEDFAVHDFQRITIDERTEADPRSRGEFSTVLPQSPLSYDGQIIKLRWCVRVRAFLTRGREVIGQYAFRVGSVRAARAAKS
jgi:hypothetical protein